MWYSAGDQNESLAIGHAVSCDGVNWNRTHEVPIFIPDNLFQWEQERVSCPSVVSNGEFFYMFYDGFLYANSSAIGIARSKDGVSNWERSPRNPIIKSTPGSWDGDAVYKPFPIFDGNKWLIWYNGRNGSVEQIGMATLAHHDLFL